MNSGERLGPLDEAPEVSLRPYAAGDEWLLQRLLGEPEMTRYLGGPEAPDAIRARHRRYLAADPETHGLYVILAGTAREPVGWIGFWESEEEGKTVWECGWNVLPEAQGRGVATAAGELMIATVRRRGRHRYLYAFPSVDNAASNALCRRLGFELIGQEDAEYPKGHMLRSNVWRLELGLSGPPHRPPEGPTAG